MVNAKKFKWAFLHKLNFPLSLKSINSHMKGFLYFQSQKIKTVKNHIFC